MRCHPLIALLAITPLMAGADLQSAPPGGHWTFGIIRQGPTFTGTFTDGDGTRVDTARDLGMGKDSTSLGFLAEYEGRRFLLHLAAYGQSFSGNQVTDEQVAVDGTVYPATTRLQSQYRLKDYELDWTIKVWRWDAAYLGVDLGINAWNTTISAQGDVTANGVTETRKASFSATAPLPQLGLSAGGHFGSDLDVRGYAHFLSVSGVSYHRVGLDVRYYPLSWLGLRANYEAEAIKAPKGSLKDDSSTVITRNGLGFGVLARF